jgi:hypothetical protein
MRRRRGPAAGGSAPPPTPETHAQHAVAALETATCKRGEHIKELCLPMSCQLGENTVHTNNVFYLPLYDITNNQNGSNLSNKINAHGSVTVRDHRQSSLTILNGPSCAILVVTFSSLCVLFARMSLLEACAHSRLFGV